MTLPSKQSYCSKHHNLSQHIRSTQCLDPTAPLPQQDHPMKGRHQKEQSNHRFPSCASQSGSAGPSVQKESGVSIPVSGSSVSSVSLVSDVSSVSSVSVSSTPVSSVSIEPVSSGSVLFLIVTGKHCNQWKNV